MKSHMGRPSDAMLVFEYSLHVGSHVVLLK